MTAYLLLTFSTLIAGFTLAKDWNNHGTSWRRIGVLALIVGVWVLGIINITTTRAQNSADKQILNDRIDGLNRTIKEGQKQAIGTISSLTDKVSKLQTVVETAELQKQVTDLKEELIENQKAMAPPPKATLTIQIAGDAVPETPTIPTVALSATVDNHISIPVSFDNTTDADALDGFAAVFMCDGCIFVKEPPGWVHVDGAPVTQRNWDFLRILSKTKGPTFTFEILPPSLAKEFQMGFIYKCRTCSVHEMRVVRIKIVK